jgi:hypothetical protein
MADTIKVNRAAAREMLAGLGFQGTEKYPDAKLLDKLNSLHAAKGVDAAVESKLSGADLATAKAVMTARRANKKLELSDEQIGEAVTDDEIVPLTDDSQPEEEETVADVQTPKAPARPAPKAPAPKPPAPTPAAPGKAAPKPASPKPPAPTPAPAAASPNGTGKPKAAVVAGGAKPKAQPQEGGKTVTPRAKDPTQTDEFGSKLGTRAARINAVVTETPKAAKVIQEEAKYDKAPQNHLRWMMTNGWATLVKGQGYKLTAKGIKARAEKKGGAAKAKAPAKK